MNRHELDNWFRCSGHGPGFVELAPCDVLGASPAHAAYHYAKQATSDGLGTGELTVTVDVDGELQEFRFDCEMQARVLGLPRPKESHAG